MNIYFAGSIRGGRDDQMLYAQIVALCKTFGKVLSEHIADPHLTSQGSHGDVQEIYSKDARWVRQADVVIAEVSTPSLGVGYELGLAESLHKPVLCLYRDGSDHGLSAMINGNTTYTKVRYATFSQAQKAIERFFQEHASV